MTKCNLKTRISRTFFKCCIFRDFCNQIIGNKVYNVVENERFSFVDLVE